MADGSDGWKAENVFDGASCGYSYDDILFMPGHVSFEASSADLSSRLSKNVALNVPLVGSPMNTVTEAPMAINLALVGGIGIIHDKQAVTQQAAMVKVVKSQEVGGFILEPATLSPNDTVADVDDIKAAGGFNGVVITDSGTLGGKIIGIVTTRDIDTVDDRSTRLSSVMTRQLVMGREPITLGEAYTMLQQKKVGKLPIVNEEMNLVSMVTRRNLKKTNDNKSASRDASGRLLVGAAVSADGDGTGDFQRAVTLLEAGADVLFIDTTNSQNEYELGFVERLKADFPNIDLVAGPVATCREAKRLCDAGVDAVRIGCARGSLAAGATGDLSVAGRPAATAVFELSRYVSLNYGIPTIADGSIRDAGQILKALCLGAASVMLDDLLAATEEAPGPSMIHRGTSARLYHRADPEPSTNSLLPGKAVGSKAMLTSTDICKPVVSKGSVGALVPYIVRCVQNGMQDLGLPTVPQLHDALAEGRLKMECRSSFSVQRAEACAQKVQRASQPYLMPVSP